MAHAADYFSEDQRQQIKNAVKQAEQLTSGEIRVCIDSKISGDTKNILVANYNTLDYSRQMINALNNGIEKEQSQKEFKEKCKMFKIVELF